MRKIPLAKFVYIVILGVGLSLVFISGSGANTYAAEVEQGENCTPNQSTILGLPTWYKYLGGRGVESLKVDGSPGGEIVCQPVIWLRGEGTEDPERLPKRDVLLIAGAVLDMLTRIAGFAAFIYLMYGGFLYLTSSGNSESIKNAGSTLLNAAIGLAIAISATTIINYLARQISK